MSDDSEEEHKGEAQVDEFTSEGEEAGAEGEFV